MRTLLIALGGGGQALDAIQLANSLCNDVEMYFIGLDNPEFSELLDPSVIRMSKSPPLIWKLRLLLDIFMLKPDILHVHWPGYGWLMFPSFMLAKILGIKIVWTAPNVVPHEARILDYLYYPLVYMFSDKIIVFSQWNRDSMQEFFENGIEKAEILPYGNLNILDKGKYTKYIAKRRLGLEGKFVVGHIGLVREYKGLNTFYAAFKNIKRENVSLLIVGPWYSDGVLLERMKLDRNVVTVDRYVPEDYIELYFKACDVIVTPYLWFEGYSSLIVAAFGFGIPVISSEVGSLPDLVKEGVTGKLVDKYSIWMPDVIEWMIDNPEEVKRMGECAKKVAGTRLSWKNVKKETLKLYRELIRE